MPPLNFHRALGLPLQGPDHSASVSLFKGSGPFGLSLSVDEVIFFIELGGKDGACVDHQRGLDIGRCRPCSTPSAADCLLLIECANKRVKQEQ